MTGEKTDKRVNGANEGGVTGEGRKGKGVNEPHWTGKGRRVVEEGTEHSYLVDEPWCLLWLRLNR